MGRDAIRSDVPGLIEPKQGPISVRDQRWSVSNKGITQTGEAQQLNLGFSKSQVNDSNSLQM